MTRIEDLIEKREGAWNAAKALLDSVDETRGLSAEDRTKLDKLNAEIDAADEERKHLVETEARQGRHAEMVAAEARRNGGSNPAGRGAPIEGLWDTPTAEDRAFGEMARGLYLGEYRDQLESPLSAGGVAVPTPVSERIFAAQKAQTRLLQAGAVYQEMTSETLLIPRVDMRPTFHSRAEAAPVVTSSAVFSGVTLTAHSIDCLTLISEELINDAPALGGQLQAEIAQAAAEIVDEIGLYGDAIGIPGIYNSAGVVNTALAANGGPLTWTTLVSAKLALQALKYDPTAVIIAPRAEAQLTTVTANDGHWLEAPAFVSSVPRLQTTQVSTIQTTGTSVANTADTFIGDFSKVVIGMRNTMTLRVLNERFIDQRKIGFLAGLRMDVQVMRPQAIQIISGQK